METVGMHASNASRSKVDVLLATYNSAKYLPDQLESLIGQSFDDFFLVVSDDGSCDETISIIESYAEYFRNPVRIFVREAPFGSAKDNFSFLLEGCNADYAFLCDHDDVWHPDRIAIALDHIKRTEALFGEEMPVLYHSDVEVIDASGHLCHSSFWSFKQMVPQAGQYLPTALMHATVVGCAAGMNRALINRAGHVPKEAIMHDWWLNLVAAAFGRVEFDPRPLVRYRIHGQNASRPREVGVCASFRQLDRLVLMRKRIRRRYAQGRALYERFGNTMPEPAREQIATFVKLQSLPAGLRQIAIVRGGFLWPGVWRNVVQLAFA
jgi:glycosyltransferase involved in cell wall biosynthesis